MKTAELFDQAGQATSQNGVALAASSRPTWMRRCLELQAPGVIEAALQTDATAKRIMAKEAAPTPGEMVGVRLNLNIQRRTGLCVHSVHKGNSRGGHKTGRGFWGGSVLSYQECIVVRNAYFNVMQSGREQIARGEVAKFPMASIDGELVRFTAPHLFDGVEVSFNPRRECLFVDPDGFAIWHAEEVTVFAHKAYARGVITYHNEHTAPARAGDAPSRARFISCTGESVQLAA